MSPDLLRTYQEMKSEIARVIIGQDQVIDEILVAVFTGGHVLLEGVPGVAKTLIARSLAAVMGAEYRRIQFTPDLLPADIIGTNVFNPAERSFQFIPGPVFTELLLADEINRTPPKTQAALLEAMQERQVTVDGKKYPLPGFFFVIATQNPVEYEGTYPLPEAQTDRFLMKVAIGYPETDREKEIMLRYHQGQDLMDLETIGLKKILSPDSLSAYKEELVRVRVEDGIFDYITAIVGATRQSPRISLGASPRAAVHLLLAGKTAAFFQERDYVNPDDIKRMVYPVLRHRLLLKPEAELEGQTPDDLITRILSSIPIPR